MKNRATQIAMSQTDISNRKWIRASECKDVYPWCRNTLINQAKKAGAYKKISNMVMINTIKLDAYIEDQGSEENTQK